MMIINNNNKKNVDLIKKSNNTENLINFIDFYKHLLTQLIIFILK
jgi:hypothetical protein